MKENTDPERNRPAEKGEGNDPNLRDSSAAQPGVNTLSSSPSDSANEEVTKTNSGSFGDTTDEDFADEDFETGGGD